LLRDAIAGVSLSTVLVLAGMVYAQDSGLSGAGFEVTVELDPVWETQGALRYCPRRVFRCRMVLVGGLHLLIAAQLS
jgi:hypothetical protein